MSFLSSSPGPTDFPEVLRQYPRRSVLMLRLANEILREESAFSVAERELIFAYVSAQNACDYCHDSHRPVAAAFGIDESVFDELQRDVDSAGIDEKLKPVLRYARKLTLTPSRMVQADAEAIYAAGWDERALVDAASICAIANFFNRIVDGVGIDVTPEQARRTGATLLPTIGYGGIADEIESRAAAVSAPSCAGSGR